MSNWRIQPEPIPESQIAFEHECDVLVVGLAHAGTAAARAAAEAGAKVIGIEEKLAERFSVWGADCGHFNSKFLESRGVPKVDPIDYYNEMMRRSGGHANPSLVMKFCQNAGTAFDWYTDMVEDFSTVNIAFWPGGNKFDGEMAGYHFWPGTAQFRGDAPGGPGGGGPGGGGPGGGGPGGPEGAPGGAPDGPGGAPGGGAPGGPEGGPPPEGGDFHGGPDGEDHGGDRFMAVNNAGVDPLEQVKTRPNLTLLAKANHQKARDLGAELFFGMSAVDILKENGRVTGIIAVDKEGKYHRYLASKSVILAAGGFGGNKEMLEDLLPDFKGLFSGDEDFPKGMGRSGISLKLGVWAGGRLEAGPIATMGGNFNTPRGFNCVHGLLWLDTNGKRFCNECFGDPVITGFQGNQLKHGTYYNIFDSDVLEDLQWAVPAHEGFDYANEGYVGNVTRAIAMAKAAGKGGAVSRAPNGPVRIVCGNDMEELLDNAELTGQLRENVKASILRYNEICKAGRDDDFGKDAKLLRPLDKWPLFIQFNDFNYLGRIMCTCGGLLTDETQNVVDDGFDPIPGLYATGNCCGRRYGPQYSTPTAGLSIGMCITLGREAGKEAAK